MGTVRKSKEAAKKAASDAFALRARKLHQEAETHAINEMASVLETLIDGKFNRPVSSLTRHELGQIAFGAINGWIIKRYEQAKELDADIDDLINQTRIGV